MAGIQAAVLGIYLDYASVESAVEVLKKTGIPNKDISVLFPDEAGTKALAHDKETRASDVAPAGARAGVVPKGVLGWLVGIGTLAIPGVGSFVAAGPFMAILAGMGVGGPVAGITSALIGLGIPEHEAKRYQLRVEEGAILLAVHSDSLDWSTRAEEILKRTGAQNVSSTGDDSADYVRSDSDTAAPWA